MFRQVSPSVIVEVDNVTDKLALVKHLRNLGIVDRLIQPPIDSPLVIGPVPATARTSLRTSNGAGEHPGAIRHGVDVVHAEQAEANVFPSIVLGYS